MFRHWYENVMPFVVISDKKCGCCFENNFCF